VNSSEDAIRRVVEAFEHSDWAEIEVRSGNVRVHLSSRSASSPSNPTSGQALIAADRVVPDDGDEARTAPAAATPATAVAHSPPPGSHLVVSPSPGIFWRSPEPGLPPFVDVGDVVDASATVCIVEVMKLMNHVKAGISGEIVAAYGENGVAVKKGQELFAIAPSGST
jgi:acetyl-CoA carboxylase biotin carboxyl carrier protein